MNSRVHTVLRPVDSSFRPVRSMIMDEQDDATRVSAQAAPPETEGPTGRTDPSQPESQREIEETQELIASIPSQNDSGTGSKRVSADDAKRHRQDGNPHSGSGSDDADDREILEMQLTTVTALPEATLERISNAAFNLQKKWLKWGRQKKDIERNIEKGNAPRSFASNASKVELGRGAEAQYQKLLDEEQQHQMKMSGILAESKQLEANEIENDKRKLFVDSVNEQLVRVQNIVNLDSDLYNNIDTAAVKSSIERQVRMQIALAQSKAAVAHENETAKIIKSRADREHQQHLKQAEELRNSTEAATVKRLEELLDERTKDLRSDLQKVQSDNNKLLRQLGKNTAKKEQSNRKKQKQNKGKGKGKNKGAKGAKGKGKGKGKRGNNDRYFRQSIVSLTDKHIPPALESVLSLGPGFRQTPNPVSNSVVSRSLREFAGAIRTRASFAQLKDEDEAFEPKLYKPSGITVDPEMPALDTVLDQYEQQVQKALDEIPPERGKPNTTAAERLALSQLNDRLADGTSDIAVCRADKDSTFVIVDRAQFNSMWRSHYPPDQYPIIQAEDVDWLAIQRNVRRVIKLAVEDGIITKQTLRFLIQYCYGEVRIPKGAILIKTHKHMDRSKLPPARTRIYVDTYSFITAPLMTYMSVQLTPSRDQIPHRVKDSRDLMIALQDMVFPQDIVFILMDVIDFYPCTSPESGRHTVYKYSPPEQRDFLLQLHDIVHGSLYQWTPDGMVKVDDQYGIGMGQAAEVCDLNWSDVEQIVLQNLMTNHNISPLFWCRMVDDYLMILGSDGLQNSILIEAFRTADTNRPITVEQYSDSVDYLDITLFKGQRFQNTGKLDSKLYTKQTSSELHLAYTSFHPLSTYTSIVEGQHRRSVIASSDIQQHTATMVQKFSTYSSRGYPTSLLTRVLLQESTQKASAFQRQRQMMLQSRNKKQQKVIALKLPYTNRTIQIQNRISVARLQSAIQSSCPVLDRASMGRLVVAHKSTLNLLEKTRPKALIAGYAGSSVASVTHEMSS